MVEKAAAGEPLRLQWLISNYGRISEGYRDMLTARLTISRDDTPSSGQQIFPDQGVLPDNGLENRPLRVEKDRIYLEMTPSHAGNYIFRVSLWGSRGELMANDLAGGQKVEVTTGVPQPVPAIVKPGCRPGFAGKEDPPSAPGSLDFYRTDTLLKDLTEEEFRSKVAATIIPLDNLGLNRSIGGEERAEAYLDMVTWDDAYRASWKNDNSINSSSCGMFVRNTWWLCGARGCELLDAAYNGGVITELLEFAGTARRGWGSGFTAKTFFPKKGDVLYLYDPVKNSQHIFTITGFDKTIVDEGGQTMVYNDDGTPASEITFFSVDGGQEDGVDKNGKKWGCQAIKEARRKMKLNKGRFMDVGTAWPFPDGTRGRPINTWIDIGQMKDKFTAEYIVPMRSLQSITAGDPVVASSSFVGSPGGAAAPAAGTAAPQSGPAAAPLPLDKLEKNADFRRLTDKQKNELRDYVNNGGDPVKSPVTTIEERVQIACDLSWSVAEANKEDKSASAVGDIFIEKLKNDPAVVKDLEAFAQLGYFRQPMVGEEAAAAPVTGAAQVKAQRQLLQVFAQLSGSANNSAKPVRKQLLLNTLEAFLDGGKLTMGLFHNPESSIGGICYLPPGQLPRVSLNTNEYSVGIKETEITGSYIKGLLSVLAHEVNHASRAKKIGATDEEHFLDEVYAYITGFIAEDRELKQDATVNWTFDVLRGKVKGEWQDLRPNVYNLGKVVDGEFGTEFRDKLRYSASEILQLPLPMPGHTNDGWNLENVF